MLKEGRHNWKETTESYTPSLFWWTRYISVTSDPELFYFHIIEVSESIGMTIVCETARFSKYSIFLIKCSCFIHNVCTILFCQFLFLL